MTWLMMVFRQVGAVSPRGRAAAASTTMMPCATATLVAMFAPRSIKHCRACGGEVALPRPGRRQPRARDLHRLRRRSTTRTRSTSSAPCRSGTTRCCSAGATSSRATACGRCRPASWSSARRPRKARCARPIEEAGARIELEGLYTLINVVRVGQVHLFYRARLLDADFAPGPESIEAQLFARRRDAMGRARLPHDEDDARALLRRPARGRASACTAPTSPDGLRPTVGDASSASVPSSPRRSERGGQRRGPFGCRRPQARSLACQRAMSAPHRRQVGADAFERLGRHADRSRRASGADGSSCRCRPRRRPSRSPARPRRSGRPRACRRCRRRRCGASPRRTAAW